MAIRAQVMPRPGLSRIGPAFTATEMPSLKVLRSGLPSPVNLRQWAADGRRREPVGLALNLSGSPRFVIKMTSAGSLPLSLALLPSASSPVPSFLVCCCFPRLLSAFSPFVVCSSWAPALADPLLSLLLASLSSSLFSPPSLGGGSSWAHCARLIPLILPFLISMPIRPAAQQRSLGLRRGAVC